MDLFRLQDLNGNGLLEEQELMNLNEKIAILHHGADVDVGEIQAHYRSLFREKLDPLGLPVPFRIFRDYARGVLEGLDRDPEAQEMILEQFVAEALAAREAMQPPGAPRTPEQEEALRRVAGPFQEVRRSVVASREAVREAMHNNVCCRAEAAATKAMWLTRI